MPRLCTMYAISPHDRRACVPWQGVCAGAHGGACGRSAGHRAYRLPMWCSICTTESPRVGERYTASLFGTLLSGGTSASCSGVSFAGFPLFSSAPSAALALCTGSWYTGTSFLGLGSGSIGAGLSCTGCSFACLWDIGHAPTRRFAYLLLGAIRSDKRRTSIRSLFLMRKNTVKSQMR